MSRILFFSALLIGLLTLDRSEAGDFRDGPQFKPTTPVIWAATSPVPQNLTVYKIVTNRLSQSLISNAMTIGSFKSVNLFKSKDRGTIEFRDKPGENEWTRFLKMSESQGWVKYYDKLASQIPPHGVPTLEEAERQALLYFVLLGGDTNQLSAKPWPHNESTFENHNPSDGRLIGKSVSRQWVCLFRQLDGIPITGNSLSVDFGCDGKPIMLEMNWQPMKPWKRVRTLSKDEILSSVENGKVIIQAFPPPQEDITQAKSYKIKNVVILYAQTTIQGSAVFKPYGSLLAEAEIGSRHVDFVLTCPIIFDE